MSACATLIPLHHCRGSEENAAWKGGGSHEWLTTGDKIACPTETHNIASEQAGLSPEGWLERLSF